jgi:hypothetical protein
MYGIDSVSDSMMCFAISGGAPFGSTTKKLTVTSVQNFQTFYITVFIPYAAKS